MTPYLYSAYCRRCGLELTCSATTVNHMGGARDIAVHCPRCAGNIPVRIAVPVDVKSISVVGYSAR